MKENARLLYENRKKGASLVIAMCVSALILALTLSVIRTGGALMDRSAANLTRQRCRELAWSFAQVLEEELCRGSLARSEEGSFYALALETMETGERVRCTAAAEEYGELTVVVRPAEREREEAGGSGSFPYEESLEAVARIAGENAFFAGAFTVSVAAELEGESYVCSTDYSSYCRVGTLFFWNGETRVYWDGTLWCADPFCTQPMTGDEETVRIHWQYEKDTVEEITVLPLREEGGAT